MHFDDICLRLEPVVANRPFAVTIPAVTPERTSVLEVLSTVFLLLAQLTAFIQYIQPKIHFMLHRSYENHDLGILSRAIITRVAQPRRQPWRAKIKEGNTGRGTTRDATEAERNGFKGESRDGFQGSIFSGWP